METSRRANILVSDQALLGMLDFDGGEIVGAMLSLDRVGEVVITIIHDDLEPMELGAEIPTITPLYQESTSMYRGRLVERIRPEKKTGRLLA